MRKIIRELLLGFLLLAFLPALTFAGTLTTKNHIVTVTQLCPEGYVSCDNVKYVGLSKKSGNSIELNGRTLHTSCADGITPCRFLGYEFKNDNITYRVLEIGILQVIQDGSEVLFEERGSWSY